MDGLWTSEVLWFQWGFGTTIWPRLLQSGVADQKAQVGALCVHLSALVEARGVPQPWVASFHSNQRLRLPQCRRTFSSISGMSVVVWWWLVWWHSSALWKQEKHIGLKMWPKGPKLQSSPRTRAVVGDLYWYQRCQEFVLPKVRTAKCYTLPKTSIVAHCPWLDQRGKDSSECCKDTA